MISIIRKKGILKIEEVWFSDKKENDRNVDIISYMQARQAFGNIDRISKTLVSDLTLSDKVLLDGVDKDCRYEIRRAQREDVKVQMLQGYQISDELLEYFVDYYFMFLREKSLEIPGKKKNFLNILIMYRDSQNLSISRAYKNGQDLVYHVYLHDETTARLLYSVSHYRNDNASRGLIGMSNRLLHYKDMLFFKQGGLKKYDWGGISERKEVRNITQFKRDFGGYELNTYYTQEGVSCKGHCALMMKKLIRKVK